MEYGTEVEELSRAIERIKGIGFSINRSQLESFASNYMTTMLNDKSKIPLFNPYALMIEIAGNRIDNEGSILPSKLVKLCGQLYQGIPNASPENDLRLNIPQKIDLEKQITSYSGQDMIQ